MRHEEGNRRRKEEGKRKKRKQREANRSQGIQKVAPEQSL